MKLLFLRGQVPQDRDPKQITYDKLEDNCDVWTQLASLLSDDYGEIWYWNGKREKKYRPSFIEKWIPDFKKYTPNFTPDVIFARGGFPEYDVVLQKFTKAFKIYYGAGKRFLPQSSFKNYNLILVDTPEQLQQVKAKFPNIKSELFIKPAADNIFYPQQSPQKEYDVIFCSNEHKAGIKGHNFILPKLTNYKVIQVGIASKSLIQKYPNITFTQWIPRKQIPSLYGKSKVAVICCSNVDSCPRIIPEALACNCPILVLDTVNLWKEKYINSQTGRIANSENFMNELDKMVQDYQSYSPYEYYKKELSLSVSANYIKGIINSG